MRKMTNDEIRMTDGAEFGNRKHVSLEADRNGLASVPRRQASALDLQMRLMSRMLAVARRNDRGAHCCQAGKPDVLYPRLRSLDIAQSLQTLSHVFFVLGFFRVGSSLFEKMHDELIDRRISGPLGRLLQ